MCAHRRWRSYQEQERQRHLPPSAASHQVTPDASSNHFTLSESLKEGEVSGPVHHSLALEETTIDDGSNLQQVVASVEEDHGVGRDARDWQGDNKQGVRSHVTGNIVPGTGYTASTMLDSTVAKPSPGAPSIEGATERRQDSVPHDFESLVQQFKKRPSWQDGLIAGGDGGHARKTSFTQILKQMALERGRARKSWAAVWEGAGLQSGLGGAAVLEEVGLQSVRGWGCSLGGGRAAIWEGVGLQSGRR